MKRRRISGRRSENHFRRERSDDRKYVCVSQAKEKQASKKFYNKCSENSRSQIVFRTDIFRKLTLGAPEILIISHFRVPPGLLHQTEVESGGFWDSEVVCLASRRPLFAWVPSAQQMTSEHLFKHTAWLDKILIIKQNLAPLDFRCKH